MFEDKINKELVIIFFILGFFMFSPYYHIILLLYIGVIIYKSINKNNTKRYFCIQRFIDLCIPILLAIGITTLSISIMETIVYELNNDTIFRAMIFNLLIAFIMVIGFIFIISKKIKSILPYYNSSTIIKSVFMGALVYSTKYVESVILDSIDFIGFNDLMNIHVLLFLLTLIFIVTNYLLTLSVIDKNSTLEGLCIKYLSYI